VASKKGSAIPKPQSPAPPGQKGGGKVSPFWQVQQQKKVGVAITKKAMQFPRAIGEKTEP